MTPEVPTTQLAGTAAIVTGAGQGVGRGIAAAFARAGAAVAVVGRTYDKVERVAQELRNQGSDVVAIQCDVTDTGSVDASVRDVLERWGRIDTLVNAAYDGGGGPLETTSEDDLDRAWRSGPRAAFVTMRACLDALRATRGNVINLGTGAGITAQHGMAAYAMTKEALRTMSRVAAVEWGSAGVRVNVLCPLAGSPGFDRWQRDNPERFANEVLSSIPLARIGDAETDIGRAAVFLASADARYITGTTLMVDGGLTYLR